VEAARIFMSMVLVPPSLTQERRKLVLAGQIAFIPTGVLTTLLSPMLPILISRWALDDTRAGNLFLVQWVSQLLGVQVSGRLLARAGFRPAFLSGLLLMACGVGTVYLGSARSGLVSVGVYGLGLGLIVPTNNMLIAEVSEGSKSAALSLLNFFWGLGAVTCSLFVAWADAHHLIMAFLACVAMVLVLLAFAVRNLPFPGAVELSTSVTPWRKVWNRPATWLFACVFFLYPGAETAVGGWIGSYVSRLGTHGAGMAVVMPVFFWSALTAGRAAGGLILRYISDRHVLRLGFAFGTAGIAILLSSSRLPGVILSALVTGLSFSTLYPINVARFSQRYGESARNLSSTMFSLAAAGPAFIPWIVGVISHEVGNLRAGLAAPLVAAAILFLIHLWEW
jgi:FHS family glucose/mannose:H+ symporter-like MFS transporter